MYNYYRRTNKTSLRRDIAKEASRNQTARLLFEKLIKELSNAVIEYMYNKEYATYNRQVAMGHIEYFPI